MGRGSRAWRSSGKLSPHRNVSVGRYLYPQDPVLLIDPEVVLTPTHVQCKTLGGHSGAGHLHSLHVPLDEASPGLTSGAGHDNGDSGLLRSGPVAEEVIVMGQEFFENDDLGPSPVFSLPLPSAGRGHGFEALSIIAEPGDLAGGHSRLIPGEFQVTPSSLEKGRDALYIPLRERKSGLGDDDCGAPLATTADPEGFRRDLSAVYVDNEGTFVESDVLPFTRSSSDQSQGDRYRECQKAFQDRLLPYVSVHRCLASGPG